MASKKKKFYAVAKGRIPGIYTEWYGDDGAEGQVRGFSGAVFQGFATREEAEQFLKKNMGRVPVKSKSASKKRSGPAIQSGAARKPVEKKTGPAVVMYTDGGCIDNPGPGGYGVVIQTGKRTKELFGGYRFTTNNRMELTACIEGLRYLKTPSSVLLYTDSQYVVNGITKGWAERWRSNGWMKNKTEKAVNPDLWQTLLELCEKHDVKFQWVKGHAGIKGNERCDQLANGQARKKGLPPDKVYEEQKKSKG